MGLLGGDSIRAWSDTILLHVLRAGDSYGYEISKEIEARSGGRFQMKETTLYAAMARLEKRGFVASYYGDESFGRRRTYYTITPEGIGYYREKCAQWRATREVIDRFTTGAPEEDRHE